MSGREYLRLSYLGSQSWAYAFGLKQSTPTAAHKERGIAPRATNLNELASRLCMVLSWSA
jgi:hypothetical protein